MDDFFVFENVFKFPIDFGIGFAFWISPCCNGTLPLSYLPRIVEEACLIMIGCLPSSYTFCSSGSNGEFLLFCVKMSGIEDKVGLF